MIESNGHDYTGRQDASGTSAECACGWRAWTAPGFGPDAPWPADAQRRDLVAMKRRWEQHIGRRHEPGRAATTLYAELVNWHYDADMHDTEEDAVFAAEQYAARLLAIIDRYRPAARAKPIVVVVRDPDWDNDYKVFNGDAWTYDMDLGRCDLSDPEEFAEWAESHELGALTFDLEGHHDAATHVRSVVSGAVERYHSGEGTVR